MFIHTNSITRDQIVSAAKYSEVTLQECTEQGSRSHARKFKFYVSGHGVTGGQWGSLPAGVKSATWDEWGIVLNYLFNVDPQATCGRGNYADREHFHWRTGNRFKTLQPWDQHLRHRWEYRDKAGAEYNRMFDTCHQSVCRCGAINRWEKRGFEWALDRDEMQADVHGFVVVK